MQICIYENGRSGSGEGLILGYISSENSIAGLGEGTFPYFHEVCHVNLTCNRLWLSHKFTSRILARNWAHKASIMLRAVLNIMSPVYVP